MVTTTSFELRTTALPRGTMLLEASAGTGKTYTITGIVLRLLLDKRIDRLSQVLVVTFTRAATQELKTRVRKALKDALLAFEHEGRGDGFLRGLVLQHGEPGARILREALRQTDEMSIATIHSFCKRVLDESAFASGMPFRSDFVDDEIPLLVSAAHDAVRLEVQTRDALVAAIAAQEGLLPDALLAPYRAYRRHANTKLAPDPRPLEDVLAQIREALAALRALAEANDLPRSTFAAVRWLKDGQQSVLGQAGEGLSDQLRTRMLADQPPTAWYLLLARPTLAKLIAKRPPPPPLDHLLFEHCTRYAEAHAQAAHSLRAALFARMDERLRWQKHANNSLSYHDLLTELDTALHDSDRGPGLLRSIQARSRIAIIDEFQDTDPLQYRVFATCFATTGLYLVGDPKQSIYAFRGADVHAYLEARSDAREATHTLAENHRSHPQLIRAVATLFRGTAAFAYSGITLPPVAAALTAEELAVEGLPGPVMQLRCLDVTAANSGSKETLTRAVAIDVAEECVRLLRNIRITLPRGNAKAALQARDLAVLTRSNQEAQLVQDELRRRGVHSAIGRAGDVFECPEMDDVLCLLRALGPASPSRLVRAAWTTPLFGLSIEGLEALDQDLDEQQRWLVRCFDYRSTFVRHGVLAMFAELFATEHVRSRLLERADGERKLTNYLQIAELLHQAEHEHHRRGESLVAWLEHERDHAQAVDQDLKELRLESDADAVQILTAHGSKGLQFEIVFVPFAWTGRRAPSSSVPLLARQSGGGYALDFRTKESDRASNLESYLREQLCEDLRLLYVALTRARRRCYVHALNSHAGHTSGLAWLLLGPGRHDVALDSFDFKAWRDGGKVEFAAWVDAAAAIANQSEDSIGCERPVARLGAAKEAATKAAVRSMATPRALPAVLAQGFRTTSFSSLCSHDRASAEVVEASDSRIVSDEPEAPTANTESSAASATAAPTGMFAFARGAAAGTCLHQLLEHADLQMEDRALLPLIEATLREHALDTPLAHRATIHAVAAVAAMLRTLRTTKLGSFGFCLQDLAQKQRAAEWRFQARARHIVPNHLAALFATHAEEPVRHYAARLRTLSARSIEGFLTGSLDLLCEHENRFFVFDWKSNWLGDSAEDYTPARLLADAQQNDYVLQYHLYVLAVHRHLKARLPNYDYEHHMGGACYVYLRGLKDGSGATGVFCDRPPYTLIAALDAWLDGVER